VVQWLWPVVQLLGLVVLGLWWRLLPLTLALCRLRRLGFRGNTHFRGDFDRGGIFHFRRRSVSSDFASNGGDFAIDSFSPCRTVFFLSFRNSSGGTATEWSAGVQSAYGGVADCLQTADANEKVYPNWGHLHRTSHACRPDDLVMAVAAQLMVSFHYEISKERKFCFLIVVVCRHFWLWLFIFNASFFQSGGRLMSNQQPRVELAPIPISFAKASRDRIHLYDGQRTRIFRREFYSSWAKASRIISDCVFASTVVASPNTEVRQVQIHFIEVSTLSEKFDNDVTKAKKA
jgi:hypothetical protein